MKKSPSTHHRRDSTVVSTCKESFFIISSTESTIFTSEEKADLLLECLVEIPSLCTLHIFQLELK